MCLIEQISDIVLLYQLYRNRQAIDARKECQMDVGGIGKKILEVKKTCLFITLDDAATRDVWNEDDATGKITMQKIICQILYMDSNQITTITLEFFLFYLQFWQYFSVNQHGTFFLTK